MSSKNESDVRSLMASAAGAEHVSHPTLREAQADAAGVVVLEGDYGGQIYLVAAASYVRCDEDQLRKLLAELDSLSWDDPDGADVYFESRPTGAGVAGGMGGGLVAPELWLHPKLSVSEAAVRGVLRGERASVLQ